MRALYTADVTARGGREGHVRSTNGMLDIDLRIPNEMGGPRARSPRQGTPSVHISREARDSL